MREGDVVVVFEPVSCGKFNKEINKIGTVIWTANDKVFVLFDDGYTFTGPRKSAKVLKNREEQELYVTTTYKLAEPSEDDSEHSDV